MPERFFRGDEAPFDAAARAKRWPRSRTECDVPMSTSPEARHTRGSPPSPVGLWRDKPGTRSPRDFAGARQRRRRSRREPRFVRVCSVSDQPSYVGTNRAS